MYETKNTAVAAALVTLGNHVTGVEKAKTTDQRGREIVSLVWRLNNGSFNTERDVALCFQRRDFKAEPLASMIKVANAREWILGNVVHGTYEMLAEPDSFVTSSIAVASCLVAENYYLRAFYGRNFYFAPGAQRFVERFKRKPDGDEPLDWQRRFLYQFAELLHRAREAAPVWQ